MVEFKDNGEEATFRTVVRDFIGSEYEPRREQITRVSFHQKTCLMPGNEWLPRLFGAAANQSSVRSSSKRTTVGVPLPTAMLKKC